MVVGLGNPGIEYQFTPHNAGFLAVDRLAQHYGVTVTNRRSKAVTAKILVPGSGAGGSEVLLAKPETWMNLSGLSVASLVKEFDIDPSRNLIVVYDELALPLGAMRIRERGSSGGHNGARSISGALGTNDWPRIRIGVGPAAGEEHGRRGKDYLLAPMPRRDLEVLDGVLDDAADAVRMIVSDGIAATMNRFNGRESNNPA